MLSGSREQGTIGMHNNILGPSQSGGETNVRQRTQGCLVLRAIGVPGQRFSGYFLHFRAKLLGNALCKGRHKGFRCDNIRRVSVTENKQEKPGPRHQSALVLTP